MKYWHYLKQTRKHEKAWKVKFPGGGDRGNMNHPELQTFFYQLIYEQMTSLYVGNAGKQANGYA